MQLPLDLRTHQRVLQHDFQFLDSVNEPHNIVPLVNLILNFVLKFLILQLFGPAAVWNQPDEEHFNVVAIRDANYVVLIHLFKTMFVTILIDLFHVLGQVLILQLFCITLDKETVVVTSREEHHARRL